MKKEKTYRIDGFEQINAFYKWIFDNPDKAKPNHISLYWYLFSQANQVKWESFRCPYYLAMKGARIGNNGTYYNCLDDLQKWGLIEYKKGINNYNAPVITLVCLSESEQVTGQCLSESEQVTGQCLFKSEHIYSNNSNIYNNNINNSNENSTPEKKSGAEDLFKEILFFFSEDLHPKTEKQKLAWIDTLEKLIRIDGHDPEIIKDVIKKTRQDDFWKANFLSVLKLRRKDKDDTQYFTVFKNKINTNQRTGNNNDRIPERVNKLWENTSSDYIKPQTKF
jgi:hypothetical protein